MAIYSLGGLTGVVAAGIEYRSASTDRARVLELSFNLVTTAGSAWTPAIGRPAAIGITPTAPITFLAENPGDPDSTVTSAIAWGTAPTAPTGFFRLARYFGQTNLLWRFDQGLVIGISSSLVEWAAVGTNIEMESYCVVDE